MTAGLLRDALALLLGFVTGVLSALFGIGGAIVSNPGLRILGAAPLVAVGTTLPSILPGAVSGTLRYRREGLIDWRLIIPAAAAGLLAVVGGSLLSHAVPGQGHLLLLLIAVLLAVTAWRTAFTGPTPEAEVPGAGDTREHPTPSAPGAGDNREHPTSPSATLPLRGTWHRRVGLSGAATPAPGSPPPTPGPAGSDPVASGRPARRRRWIAAGIGLSAGLLSGLLGIGGGVIMVPAFTELLSMSLKSAIATSLVCVGIFGVPATITHAFLGDVDWRLAILLAIGVIPGARVGAALTIRTAERRLRLAVGVFLALVALVYFVTETRALLAL
ncbi:MAG: sulfite exporter TauE/SafE family protein [Actinomycetes bacterium]